MMHHASTTYVVAADCPQGMLTPRQRECLSLFETCGTAPTFNQIAQALGLKSRGNAHNLVKRLVVRGHLVRRPRERGRLYFRFDDEAKALVPLEKAPP